MGTCAFFLRSLLATPFTPLPFFFLLLIAGWGCKWRKKHKAARLFCYAAVGWLAVISTGPVPNFLVDSLEKQNTPLKHIDVLSSEKGIHIMVLGAGHNTNPMLPVTQQLSETVMVRLVEGIRLHRLIPDSKLVSSGPRGTQTESQAAVVRNAAIQFGVAPGNIDTLSNTTNTKDEAMYYRERFGTGQKVIIVTDAVHMPRALRWFQREGNYPIPAPTNYMLKEEKSKRAIGLIPNSQHIKKMEKAVHEYLGTAWMLIENED